MSRTKLPPKNFEWSSDLAYAVGLLVTDGNLSKDGQHVILRSTDIQLIRTFKKCLNLNNKIGSQVSYHKNGRPSFYLQFGGAQFYRWLIQIGLFPAKTYTIGSIEVPDEYFKDFLRGHLDGDGSITTYLDRYNTFKDSRYVYVRLWVRFISASKEHISWLQDSISRLCGVHGHYALAKAYGGRRARMSVLKYGKRESLQLLQWLYYRPNLPCLARKRKIADKFLLQSL